MPKQVLPTKTDFADFEKRIMEMGFQRRPKQRTMAGLYRDPRLTAPARKFGAEVQFSFTANGLTAYVLTTFLNFEECFQDEDSGWVVIRQDNQRKYFSHPMMRTKNFLQRLLIHAKIAKEKVLNRPYCPGGAEDGHFMNIAEGVGLKSKYWECKRCGEKLAWDEGMSEESVNFLKAERKARKRYNSARKKAGLPPFGWAMLHRQPWGIVDPKNQF